MRGALKIVLVITQSKLRANAVNDSWLLLSDCWPNWINRSYPVATTESTITGTPALTKIARAGPSAGDITVAKIPRALHHFAKCDRIIGAPLKLRSCVTKRRSRSPGSASDFFAANH